MLERKTAKTPEKTQKLGRMLSLKITIQTENFR